MVDTRGANALKKMRKALDEAQVAVEIASYRFTRATDRRVRLAMATLIVLLLHLWFLWAILASNPGVWNVPDMQVIDDAPTVELWPPEPTPETVPPVEQIVPEVQPQPQAQPRQAVQEPQPQPEPQPAPQQQAAPPQPVAQPEPAPQIVVPKVAPAPVIADTSTPVIDAQTKPSLSTKVKKKAAAQLAKTENDDIVTSVTDLNLHQVPTDAPVLSTVEPSGIPAPAKGAPTTTQAQGGQPGGRLGAMQGQGVPGAGVLGKGRGGLTQAMQNHDYCVAQQQAGKPIPAGCNMTDLAGMSNIPGKRVAAYDKALARQAYTAAPGNTDYWQRVNGVPVDPGKDDHMPKKGAYTTAKDQRMVGGCIDDSSCGVH